MLIKLNRYSPISLGNLNASASASDIAALSFRKILTAIGPGAVLRASVAFRSLVDVQGAVYAAVRNVDSYHSRPVSIEARAALN
jgi:hypothetical protein